MEQRYCRFQVYCYNYNKYDEKTISYRATYTIFGISQKACNVFGKIKFVEYGEDYKVKFVDYGEDLKIKYVKYGEGKIGKWKAVDYGEDYKLKVVKYGEDFKAKEVEYGEGCN